MASHDAIATAVASFEWRGLWRIFTLAAWLAVHSQRPSHELFPHGVVPKILKEYV
jgi:hypothetical protein